MYRCVPSHPANVSSSLHPVPSVLSSVLEEELFDSSEDELIGDVSMRNYSDRMDTLSHYVTSHVSSS